MSKVLNLSNRIKSHTNLLDSGVDVKKNMRLAISYYSDMAKIISLGDSSDDDCEMMADSYQRIVESVPSAILRNDGLSDFLLSIRDEIHEDLVDDLLKVSI